MADLSFTTHLCTFHSGCKHARVDTYSFEARPFYERAGYEVFGGLDDYPAGHQKYFLQKTLIGG